MIKEKLKNLNQKDIYSLLMFALYKLIPSPEYSSISQLAYILDMKNFLNLCEYFGGQTIKIPTITELEELTQALLVYQMVNIEGMQLEEALKKMNYKIGNMKKIKSIYAELISILGNYSFNGVSDEI